MEIFGKTAVFPGGRAGLGNTAWADMAGLGSIGLSVYERLGHCFSWLLATWGLIFGKTFRVFPYGVRLGQTGKCQDVCVKSLPVVTTLCNVL